jgi:hypothetical protein
MFLYTFITRSTCQIRQFLPITSQVKKLPDMPAMMQAREGWQSGDTQ